jgi:tRNA threonylcarbamoyladenosine biosynthesis protein TsaE
MDLYRIDSLEEFDHLGTEDFMYGNGVTVIEWSEKIIEILPENTIIINISILPDKKRRFEIAGI